MINEDRVRELYAISTYESQSERKDRQMGQYYKSDYIWKELIKSFFTGSIAYVLMAVLWAVANSKGMAGLMTGDENLTNLVLALVLLYVIFMIVYMLVTYFAFQCRFRDGRKSLKSYYKHLKTVNTMYKREENLKQN